MTRTRAGPGWSSPELARPATAGRDAEATGLPGMSAARDLVQAPPELAAAVAELLAGVVVADDLRAGLDVLRDRPGLRVVTRDGDLLGAHWARGGSSSEQSLLSLRAAGQQASARLADADAACQLAERELAAAVEAEEQIRQELAEAQAALQQVDAAAAQTSGRLGTLAGAARAARDEVSRLTKAIGVAEQSRQQSLAAAGDLQARLAEQEAPGAAAAAGPDGQDGAAGPDKQQLADAATAARALRWTPGWRSAPLEERLRAISGRADSLAAAAAAERTGHGPGRGPPGAARQPGRGGPRGR